MKTKKTEKAEVQQDSWQVTDLYSLKEAFKGHKPTPIERVFATRLLTSNFDSFVYQKKITLPEGNIVNGRKYFLIDFYIYDPSLNIGFAIEVDGKIHDESVAMEKDRYRDMFLLKMGIVTFRFDWNDVMENNDNFDVLDLVHSYVENREMEVASWYTRGVHETFELDPKTYKKKRDKWLKTKEQLEND